MSVLRRHLELHMIQEPPINKALGKIYTSKRMTTTLDKTIHVKLALFVHLQGLGNSERMTLNGERFCLLKQTAGACAILVLRPMSVLVIHGVSSVALTQLTLKGNGRIVVGLHCIHSRSRGSGSRSNSSRRQ